MPYISPKLKLTLSKEYMTSTVAKENNPLMTLSKAIVNLNKSKEDPDIKAKYREQLERYINSLLEGNKKGEMISVYHTPAIKISEEPESWGFMVNNVQEGNFVLSSGDSFKLLNLLEG